MAVIEVGQRAPSFRLPSAPARNYPGRCVDVCRSEWSHHSYVSGLWALRTLG